MRITTVLRGATLAACVPMLGLAACSTTQYSGFSDAPMAQIAVVQHPRVNEGIIPAKAYERIDELSGSCQKQIHPQVAGLVQSSVNGAVPGAATGYVGLNAGSGFLDGVDTGAYGLYGAAAGAVNGAQNGAVVGSAAAATAVANCVDQFWKAIDQREDSTWRGTFTVPVIAGKSWGSSRPPALEQAPAAPPAKP